MKPCWRTWQSPLILLVVASLLLGISSGEPHSLKQRMTKLRERVHSLSLKTESDGDMMSSEQVVNKIKTMASLYDVAIPGDIQDRILQLSSATNHKRNSLRVTLQKWYAESLSPLLPSMLFQQPSPTTPSDPLVSSPISQFLPDHLNFMYVL
ncbi:MAG: hypothetical protein Q8P67_15630 [archaeon]|nr:hypothetical protein [archaeon]